MAAGGVRIDGYDYYQALRKDLLAFREKYGEGRRICPKESLQEAEAQLVVTRKIKEYKDMDKSVNDREIQSLEKDAQKIRVEIERLQGLLDKKRQEVQPGAGEVEE